MAGCSRGLDLSKHPLHAARLLFTNLVVSVTFYTKDYQRLEGRAPTLEDVFLFFLFWDDLRMSILTGLVF